MLARCLCIGIHIPAAAAFSTVTCGLSLMHLELPTQLSIHQCRDYYYCCYCCYCCYNPLYSITTATAVTIAAATTITGTCTALASAVAAAAAAAAACYAGAYDCKRLRCSCAKLQWACSSCGNGLQRLGGSLS
jgi:hypothetical protein